MEWQHSKHLNASHFFLLDQRREQLVSTVTGNQGPVACGSEERDQAVGIGGPVQAMAKENLTSDRSQCVELGSDGDDLPIVQPEVSHGLLLPFALPSIRMLTDAKRDGNGGLEPVTSRNMCGHSQHR
jgi:hypothetical protein